MYTEGDLLMLSALQLKINAVLVKERRNAYCFNDYWLETVFYANEGNEPIHTHYRKGYGVQIHNFPGNSFSLLPSILRH